MKVTIIDPYNPWGDKIGGAESFMKVFIKSAPDHFAFDFIGIGSEKFNPPPLQWHRVALGSRDMGFYPLLFERDENRKRAIPLSLRFVLKLRKSIIRHIQPECLVFNRIEPPLSFRGIGIPQVVFVHNDIQKQILSRNREVMWSRIPRLYLKLEKHLVPHLDTIFTVSQDTFSFFGNRYPDRKDKFSLIPTMLDTDHFFPVEECKSSIRRRISDHHRLPPSRNHWILFSGRFQAQKAPDRLLSAFHEFHRKNRSSLCILVGDGNLKNHMARQIRKLKLENDVRILGNIRPGHLVDFYRCADTLLLTSDYEGMPISVLEALGCGLPVVATDVGEIKKVVKSGYSGEISQDFSPGAIARLIKQVCDHPRLYSPQNCLNAISDYTPAKVLKPVYRRIEELARFSWINEYR